MPGKITTRLRFKLGSVILLGPGKQELLEGIERTGSISAAARAMGMSYKRAWQLVDEMNRHFALPVVAASFGGRHGGGARLTEFGTEALHRYQRMVAILSQALADDIAWLETHSVSAE